jgi:hypothetical protein
MGWLYQNCVISMQLWQQTTEDSEPQIPAKVYSKRKVVYIAQAVSRRLPTAAARVQNRVWLCGIL